MKKLILFQALILSLIFLFSTSCSHTRMAGKSGNYPVVKKIKQQKKFHANFKAGKNNQRNKEVIASNDRVKLEKNTGVSLKLKKKDGLTRDEIEAIREAGERLEKPARTIASTEKRLKLAMMDDEDILASLNENTLAYVILKKSLKKANKKAESFNPPGVRERNPLGFGIASLVLGAVGLFFMSLLFGSLAIIFGAISLSRYKKFGGTMKGIAIAGLILGIIDVGIMLIILAAGL